MPESNIAFDAYSEAANGPWKHLVKWCLEKYEEFGKSAYRTKKIKEAKKCRSVYEQQEDKSETPWDGASAVTLPLTTITVDNMEPRLVAGLVGQRPYVRLEIEGQKELPPELQAMQDWFDNELEDVTKLEGVAQDICHNVQLEGTVFVLPKYDIRTEKRRVMSTVDPNEAAQLQQFLAQAAATPPEAANPELAAAIQAAMQRFGELQRAVNGVMVDEQGKPIWTDSEEKTYEGVCVEFLNFNDVFMPDDVDDDQYEDAPILRMVRPTYAELYRDANDQTQEGWLADNVNKELFHTAGDGKLTEEQQSVADQIAEVQVSGKKVIDCLECYVSYTYREENDREEDQTDFEEERLVVLIALERKTVLRVRLLRSLNPQNYHLVRRITINREKGQSYGTTVYHKMKSIQDGASRAWNLAINTGEVQLRPWGFFGERSGLDKIKGKQNQLEIGLGQLHKVDDVSQILFPQLNGNALAWIEYLNIWSAYHERIFNIGDLQVGRTEGETATETLAVIQEGNIGHNYRSKRSRGGFLGLIQCIWDLNYAWMPLDKTILIDGVPAPFPRTLMQRGPKLRLTSTTEMANKLIQRKETEDLFTLAMSEKWGVSNPIKAYTELVKAFNKDNPDEWVNPQVNQVVQILQQFPAVAPLFMQAVQQVVAQAQAMEGQAKSEVAAGMAGSIATEQTQTSASPPTGEPMAPKFAPGPQDVVKPVGV